MDKRQNHGRGDGIRPPPNASHPKRVSPGAALPDNIRFFGDDTDHIDYVNGAENRIYGDDTGRNGYFSGAEKRIYGDGADRRIYGDGADRRMYSDGADRRIYGNGVQNRKFGDETGRNGYFSGAEKRIFGDGADRRTYGDGADRRICGDGVENRHDPSQPDPEPYSADHGPNDPNAPDWDASAGEAPVSGRRGSRVAVVIALFLLIYIPLAFSWFNGKNPTTDILREGSLYEAYNTEAVVIRDEEPLYSPVTGLCVPLVGAGERVPGRSAVASVYGQVSLELMEDLKRVNKELLAVQFNAVGDGAAGNQEVVALENEIKANVRKILPEIGLNQPGVASQYINVINGLLLRRAEAFGDMETDDPYVMQLKTEKSDIEKEMAKNSGAVYCESPGYLSFAPDGDIEKISPSGILDITIDDYNNILAEERQGGADFETNPNGGAPVYEKTVFAKIVKGNVFYLMICAPSDIVAQYSIGDRVRLRTESPGRDFENAEVFAINVGQGDGLLTLRLTRYLFDFLDDRIVNVALINKYMEGLKIPLKCLLNIDYNDGTAEAALVRGSVVSFRKVKILASNDIYAIIDSYDETDQSARVGRYDTYIIDVSGVTDGMSLSRQ